jgi:butyryl-CoA dehydrogenase
MASTNPLVSDRDVAFLLHDVLKVEELCKLPYFSDHSRETFDLYLDSCRRLARGVLFPAYKPMDEQPAHFHDGRISVHPRMKEMYPQLVELGLLNASRPAAVGGQQLPLTVASLATTYLMAANLSAYGFIGLSAGAAHLMETFGDEWMRHEFMARVYSGEWTGTMALTEPGAGSSLSDVKTKAISNPDGTYSIQGNKIFISGADHDLADNVVNMTLARIEGAPAGIKGVSLFAIPKLRPGKDGKLEANDVSAAGAIHKIGWRGLPSLVLNFGENNDCRGWLVGEPHKGISYMFQMMNEARIMIGMNGVATASVAYQEALLYAQTRLQGRPLTARDPKQPQIPLIEHADVRRMLLRQKAIVEGGLALLVATSYYADLAEHGADAEEKKRCALLLDLLTPVAKTFPAEWGFESNALAVQIHGGYGYSSEYLPEAWLRDQKLNSIHEGTTGIQSMDLLGRKAIAEGGAAMQAFQGEVTQTIAAARAAGVDPRWCDQLAAAMETVAAVTMALAQKGMQGDAEGMMRHSFHYMQLFSITAVAWQWLKQAAVAKARCASASEQDQAFFSGKLQTAKYWMATELPRVFQLAELCRSGDDSYAAMQPAWF